MNFHIEGRRWFQKTYGNTYNTVRIFQGNEQIGFLPEAYGYGDHYLQRALDWLREKGHIDGTDERGNPIYGTRYVREDLHSTYSVTDVGRERDL